GAMSARLTIAVPLLLACASAGPGLHGPVTAAAQERDVTTPEREPAAPPQIRLPALEVTGTRLPSTPLPASSVPAAVDVISGRVLNIITKRGAEVREIVPEAEWGSFGRQKYRFRLGGVEGPADYYVAGTFFSEDGWRDASASRVGRLFTRVGLRAGGTDLAVSYQRAQNHI